MAPDSIVAQVYIAEQISDEAADMLVAGWASLGVSAELRVLPPRRSASEVAWLLVTLPIEHFFGRLAETVADDTHERLRAFVNEVLRRDSTKSEKRVLELEDPGTGVRVVLESDLPAESYRQLLSYDMTTVQRGPLRYDRQRRQWRSERNEPDDSAAPAISG